MYDHHLLQKVTQSSGFPFHQVKALFQLLSDGGTVAFIARYRKERTGNLTETDIRTLQKSYLEFQELEDRKKFIIKTLEEQKLLTPALQKQIENTSNIHLLEDLYAPYKKKKKTRGDLAIENGLLPLAELILKQTQIPLSELGKNYINDKITNLDSALEGSRDIIAEKINLDEELKSRIRTQYFHSGILSSRIIKSKEKEKEAQVYADYFNWDENIKKILSHRFLAIQRGLEKKFLRIKIKGNDEEYIEWLNKKYANGRGPSTTLIKEAIVDSWDRLIQPSIENYWWGQLKEKSDDVAIDVFGKNLKQLLMEAPLGEKKVLAIDPGFRSGSKFVALDENGNVIKFSTQYPLAPQNQSDETFKILDRWIQEYNISNIAVGDGTGGREIQEWLDSQSWSQALQIHSVSESGASIYSASEIAIKEFPELDITLRGAISIGRRLKDPLAELIKIDPKSIGIGQYQHDVNPKKLKENLDATVLSCVHSVGVNLNTASKFLLEYVSGIGPNVAESIIKYRMENGNFKEKKDLLSVPKLGPKAFELSAGFIRIKGGKNALDNTGIHPEQYSLIHSISKEMKVSIENLIMDHSLPSKIPIAKYISEKSGEATLKDIIRELEKPGQDPRGEVEFFSFDYKIREIADLHVGMIIPAIVTNLAKFGAFVDLGIKTSGFIHISEISDRFISDPAEILSVRQKLQVRIIALDIARNRIQLSLKNIH